MSTGRRVPETGYVNNSDAAKRIRLDFSPEERCHSGRDGECSWDRCPQERYARRDYQWNCPLDRVDEDE
jgi:hypothetical protein